MSGGLLPGNFLPIIIETLKSKSNLVCFSKFCSLEFFNFNLKFYFVNFLIYEFEIKKIIKNSEKMENYWPTILATKKHDHLCINWKTSVQIG